MEIKVHRNYREVIEVKRQIEKEAFSSAWEKKIISYARLLPSKNNKTC